MKKNGGRNSFDKSKGFVACYADTRIIKHSVNPELINSVGELG